MSTNPKTCAAPRGTSDILPAVMPAWEFLEKTSRETLKSYGYQEIRTPIYEETGLFKRSLGQTSDVVNKQLLELRPTQGTEPGKESDYSLRPEGTAAVMRSYIENSIYNSENLSKYFYIGPMFRGERPQKGRLRQFHQIGVEALGAGALSPLIDVEVIALAVDVLNRLGISGFKLKLNSLGSAEDKKNFSAWLRERIQPQFDKLCADCQSRFERNVFRILDCKNPQCREVVKSLNLGDSHLSPESQTYFNQVKDMLGQLGITFEVSPQLVRGLDYYTHVVFEIVHEGLGSQDALGAGGRYNTLYFDLGGDERLEGKMGAAGFALGIERILLALGEKTIAGFTLDAFVIVLDAAAQQQGFRVLQDLRRAGIKADMSFTGGSMKSQMRQANKNAARYVLILGEDEVKNGTVSLKNMESGEQAVVPAKDIVEIVKRKL